MTDINCRIDGLPAIQSYPLWYVARCTHQPGLSSRFGYSQIGSVDGLTYLALTFPSIFLPSLSVTTNSPEIDFSLRLHP
jgi:hypothetical protein